MKRQDILIPAWRIRRNRIQACFCQGFLGDAHSFRSTKTGLDLCASARLYALAAHVGTPAGLGLRWLGLGGLGGKPVVAKTLRTFANPPRGPKRLLLPLPILHLLLFG